MNCKQGDLALIIGGDFMGGLVRCLRWVGNGFGVPGYEDRYISVNDAWEIEGMSGEYTGEIGVITDSLLRPIRGTPETEDIDHDEPVEA